MEMPNNCQDCPFEDTYDGYNCRIVEKSANWGLEGRPSWCPLIEVPPHGDLIGRNPLIDIAMHLRNRAKDEHTKRVIGSVIRYIAEAPTIIQASEEVYNVCTNALGNLHWTGSQSVEHTIQLTQGE
jgi:hypothetical protein